MTKQDKDAMTLASKPTKANACCTLIINVTMSVIFAIYAFNNPDKDECYVKRNEFGTYDVYQVEPEDGSYINVGQRYRICFVAGFALSVLNLIYAVFAMIYIAIESPKVLTFVKWLVGASGALTIAWMVYASIVTWSDN